MFFDAKYILESPRTCERFGICDTPSGAYSTNEHEENWEAVVVNKELRVVQFVPVDHNMEFRDANGDLLSTCDGMLFTGDNRHHPNFHFSRKQEMQEFYNKYKFRLIYLYEISL